MRSPQRSSGSPSAAAAIGAAVAVVGVAYGTAAAAAGVPGWLIVLTAVTALGASAELLFIAVIAAGGLPLVAAGAALIVNVRNILYGLSVGAFLPRGPLARPLHAHLVNDESVAFAMAEHDPAERLRAFRLVGFAILVAWPTGAAVGALLGHIVPDPDRLGLDAAFPTVFMAILLGLVNRRSAVPAASGALIAIAATPVVAAGLAPVLSLLGLAASTNGEKRA
ncbi:AzlC family ABC transporter permease [Aeromicrobium endophyticum]|uniref:Branched-chain amino acid ABC transporter permease n=1 Tax=Aeromicrobium endophyticum TaxID=2292704 RepID=A0A371P9U4_9ACTN|nr:AzlC family ABC transporter permease [Aeromicrobium endophyticum]REK72733.1 branched-chain amino acid ABC transporter permease [Aeromicrobium endophyticum]